MLCHSLDSARGSHIARQKSRFRVSGTIVKHLTIWLTAVTVLYELILALNRRYYFDPSDVAFRVADGFLIQYVGSVQFLFTQLGISQQYC